jgi:ComF family protein
MQKMKQKNKGLLYRTWRYSTALLGLQRCLVCQKNIPPCTKKRSALEYLTCHSCCQQLRGLYGVRCTQCGLTLGPRLQAFGWTHCRHCKTQTTPQLQHTLVCADYHPPVDQWITRLKYGKQLPLAQFLGIWLADTASQSNAPRPDVLLPVPSTPSKLRKRGYNQALLIAKTLGAELGIPVHTDWLIKRKESKNQAGLDRQARLANLNDVFRSTRPIAANMTIGLVDDVMTTGATFESCAHALRKAGAQHIVMMAVYRTPEQLT